MQFSLPPRLKPGDSVAVVSPASPQKKGEEGLVQAGVSLLESWGLRVIGPDSFRCSKLPYLAAEDEVRAAIFEKHYFDDDIRAVFVTRGGYGCSRLIGRLKSGRIRTRRKIVAGFSDVTSLLLYLMKTSKLVVYHAPGIATRQFVEQEAAREDLRRHLFEEDYGPSLHLQEARPGRAEGFLTGGCLSLVVTTLGTPWEIDTRGSILFLEDVGEPLYRIDRMLTHLRSAGKFKGVRGIVFGEMKGLDTPIPFCDFLAEFFRRDRFPVGFGLPCGHGATNLTLPLGLLAELDSGKGRLRIIPAGG